MRAYLTGQPIMNRVQAQAAEVAEQLRGLAESLEAGEWNQSRYWVDRALDQQAEITADLSALQRLIDAHQRPA